MLDRIRALAIAVMVALLSAGPALAEASGSSLEGTEQGIGSSAPEPTAALLFAAGAGFVAWSLRRRTRR